MRKSILIICLCFTINSIFSQDHQTFKGNQSPDWNETISQYQELAEKCEFASLESKGLSDVGKPIHLFLLRKDSQANKPTLLINNAIHPGEPCGVDASILFAKELISEGDWADEILNQVNIAIIPMYNIGGALNRGCCSRANQNGPEEYGFRGNAKNLDLNRDFIKCDSRNAQAFYKIFHELDPHAFVDTHTTNGADYRYVMTLISTQPDKAGPVLNEFIRNVLEPELYSRMESAAYPMTPYVNTVGETPETGIIDFLESPRYSTGYTALFNCIGFTSEAHMFKAYEERVEATYWFIRNLAQLMSERPDEFIEKKKMARTALMNAQKLPLEYELDTTNTQIFSFKGFQAIHEPSEISGKTRLRYDRDAPVDFDVNWFHTFIPTNEVEVPYAYLIPQAWTEVIERLQINDVEFEYVKSDGKIKANTYYIDDFNSPKSPYEGHFLHRATTVIPISSESRVYQGDVIVKCNQVAKRYLVESLEPGAPDSFFSWNFFDSILQQKEWFSDYIFEEEAKEILESDPELKAEFEKMKEDAAFRDNHFAQLYFIYQHSANYESTYNLYPVLRLNESGYQDLIKN